MGKAKILDKIRKLLAIAADSGATPAEVENAIAQAEKLRKKYQIDISEIDMSVEDIDYKYILLDERTFEFKHWVNMLCNLIAEGYNCKTILCSVRGKEYIRIVGFQDDMEMCENVIFSTKNIIREMSDIQWKINGRKKDFRSSYIAGFLMGLIERLKSEREQKFELEESNKKYQLVVVKKEELVVDYIYKNWSVSKGQGNRKLSKIKDDAAFDQGVKDGAQRNYNSKALKC